MGSIISRAKRESLLFTFFVPLAKKRRRRRRRCQTKTTRPRDSRRFEVESNRAYRSIETRIRAFVSNLLRTAINRIGERDVDRFPSEKSSRWREVTRRGAFDKD